MEARAWWAVALGVLVLYLASVPPVWQCEGVDEIDYLSLADSLHRGMGYTVYGATHVIYPPLYPALLAPALDTPAPVHWPRLYRLNAAAGWIALVVLCAALRRRDPTGGVPASWFALLAYYPWSFSTRYLMAEPVHFLAVALALVCVGVRTPSAWAWAGLLAAAVAAVLSKAGGLALVAALGTAGLARGVTRRSFRAAGPLLAVAAVAGAFLVGWEVRAAVLDPGAKESYGRWLLKWIGLSHETSGVVAANYGEGVSGPTSLPQRAGYVVARLGQYLLSIPRDPPNLPALSVLLGACVLLGIGAELRRAPDAVAPWFVLFTFGMMATTSWVSSYLRYLYPVTPLLFFYAVQGARSVRALLAFRPRPGFAALQLGGAAVLVLTAWRGWSAGTGAESGYRTAIGLAVAAVGVILLFSPLLARVLPARAVRCAWVALAVALAGNALALAVQRERICRSGVNLEKRGLDHAFACAAWVRAHLSPDARVASSLPRLAAILTSRPYVDWPETGDPVGPSAYIWLLGSRPGGPLARPDREASLQARVRSEGWLPLMTSGPAGVYGRPQAGPAVTHGG